MEIAQLLERELISADDSKVGDYLNDKIILITGAAGSVGSELAKRMAAFSPKKVLLLDYAESSLYELEWEINKDFPKLNFEIILANIVEKNQLIKIFSIHRPDIIFHTAAYKQVPILEKYPEQAVLTNIIGTKNLADLSLEYGVEKMIFISTDKAVNPVSIMGTSKKIAENYILSLAKNKFNTDLLPLTDKNYCLPTQFIITRFGNVLGSSGSVVPLFKKQIAAGGPVTITHRDMTRFFMAISEAAQLVLEAGWMGKGGEIFWFNFSKPVSIFGLAQKIIFLSNKKVEIIFSGIRPGEKIHEEWMEKENISYISHDPYLVALHESEIFDFNEICDEIEKLNKMALSQNSEAIKKIMQRYQVAAPIFDQVH